MEKLPHFPRSLPHIRNFTPISPSSVRMLKQAMISRDTSKFINLSSTVRNINARPVTEGLELSFQLTTLRKNLDKYSLTNFHQEARLRELRSKLKQLNDSQIVTPEDIQRQKYYNQLKHDIKKAKIKENEEIEDQKVLEFIRERLGITNSFLEKKEKKLKKMLEFHIHDAEIKSRLRKETIDSVHQYKLVYKSALNALDYESNALVTEISSMEAQSRLKKSIISKTEEHNKHRLEIIEQTMIDERSAHLEELRIGLALSKMLCKFLSKKLVHVKITFSKLDDAFQKVRLKTGLYNVDEVIERFLTQEANYRDLTFTLHRREQQCGEYKQRLDDLQAAVNRISQETPGKRGDSEELKFTVNRVSRCREKKHAISKEYLKINIWVDSILKKMSSEERDFEGIRIKEKFEMLKEIIVDIVKEKKESIKESVQGQGKLKLEAIVEIYLAVKRARAAISNEKVGVLKGQTKHRSNS